MITYLRAPAVIFTLIATTLALPLTAHAFTLNLGSANQNAAGWKTSKLSFDIDTSCASYRTTVEAAINASADVWNAVPTSALTIAVGSTVTLSGAIATYVGNSATSYAPVANPIVYCDANFSTTSGQSADSIPGYAGGINMKSDGQIQGALLVLNVQSGGQANITTLDSTLVNAILAHEIGHVLGLGHSSNTQALMYYATGVGRKPVLNKDDMDGVTFLYPREELGASGLMGCNSTQFTSGPFGGGKRGDAPRSSQNGFPTGAAEFTLLGLACLIALRAMKRASRDITQSSTA